MDRDTVFLNGRMVSILEWSFMDRGTVSRSMKDSIEIQYLFHGPRYSTDQHLRHVRIRRPMTSGCAGNAQETLEITVRVPPVLPSRVLTIVCFLIVAVLDGLMVISKEKDDGKEQLPPRGRVFSHSLSHTVSVSCFMST